MENPETIDVRLESDLTVVKLQIQRALMEAMGINSDNENDILNWIVSYSERFSDYIQADHGIIELWQNNDSETQEKIIEDIRKIISGDEG